MRLSRLVAVAAAVLVPSLASAQVVYSNDFETDTHGLTGPTPSSLISYPGGCTSSIINCSGHYLGNTDGNPFRLGQSFELNLTGLGAHTGLNISFDFLALLSLDGNGPLGGGTDPLVIQVDGVTQFNYTFANFTGGNSQSYCPGGSDPCAPRTGSDENDTLGYGSGDFGTSLYEISFDVAHTGSTATIDFYSDTNQDWSDEGMGYDNLQVSMNGSDTVAPEPASLVLMGTGLVGLAGIARRKRAR